ncbi:hypothetical protein [Polaromonas sp. YR568]|uniref:hypothetical protein n=1 Tax=Polaromonas sp. YR568 TaxID=1855301 RepID=UPI003137DB53
MLHPIFSTLAQRPDLVVEHLSAYAALARQEASSASGKWLTRAMAWVLTALLLVVFLGLTGTALMLGVLQDRFHWVLVLVPGCVLAAALLAWRLASKPQTSQDFVELKSQLDSDMQALRVLGSTG